MLAMEHYGSGCPPIYNKYCWGDWLLCCRTEKIHVAEGIAYISWALICVAVVTRMLEFLEIKKKAFISFNLKFTIMCIILTELVFVRNLFPVGNTVEVC